MLRNYFDISNDEVTKAIINDDKQTLASWGSPLLLVASNQTLKDRLSLIQALLQRGYHEDVELAWNELSQLMKSPKNKNNENLEILKLLNLTCDFALEWNSKQESKRSSKEENQGPLQAKEQSKEEAESTQEKCLRLFRNFNRSKRSIFSAQIPEDVAISQRVIAGLVKKNYMSDLEVYAVLLNESRMPQKALLKNILKEFNRRLIFAINEVGSKLSPEELLSCEKTVSTRYSINR